MITCNGDGGVGRNEGADGVVGQALVHALVAVAPPRSLVQHLAGNTAPTVSHLLWPTFLGFLSTFSK